MKGKEAILPALFHWAKQAGTEMAIMGNQQGGHAQATFMKNPKTTPDKPARLQMFRQEAFDAGVLPGGQSYKARKKKDETLSPDHRWQLEVDPRYKPGCLKAKHTFPIAQCAHPCAPFASQAAGTTAKLPYVTVKGFRVRVSAARSRTRSGRSVKSSAEKSWRPQGCQVGASGSGRTLRLPLERLEALASGIVP